MAINLKRLFQSNNATFGALSIEGTDINVFTLEDIRRDEKVYGETRIPAGKYKLSLQESGKLYSRYSKKNFGIQHKGMILLNNVPNFSGVMIHIGNTSRDTNGCILVGMSANIDRGNILSSTAAYIKIYPIICDMIESKETFLTVSDEV